MVTYGREVSDLFRIETDQGKRSHHWRLRWSAELQSKYWSRMMINRSWSSISIGRNRSGELQRKIKWILRIEILLQVLYELMVRHKTDRWIYCFIDMEEKGHFRSDETDNRSKFRLSVLFVPSELVQQVNRLLGLWSFIGCMSPWKFGHLWCASSQTTYLSIVMKWIEVK